MPSQAKPVWSCGYKPDAADLKGLYHHTYETSGGLTIECYLEFEAGEAQTWDHPGCAAQCTLVWALVEGVDISEVIDIGPAIEEAAMLGMESDANDCLADIAADRYEDARCEA